MPYVAGLLEALDEVEELPELHVPLRHGARDPGRRPTPDEDPVNAFVRVCHIEGAEGGPLAGKRVGVKDNLAVAGIPVTNASRTLSFTPVHDAVVVERVLDAGATIVGKLNLDDFSASGYGDTSVFGPARNPLDPSRSAGGSSSGAGAALAAGLVDLAIGVDQGGSVRMPAAACGVVGLKATTGLIPSFGLSYIDHAFDCVGPLGRTVRDVAELLTVIAGPDWRDPQWVRDLETDDYLAGLDDGVAGLRVGVIEEALANELCEPPVLAGIETAAEALRDAGATVERVSVPLWSSGFAIWIGTLLAGWPPMLRTNGIGTGHFGYVDVERVHAQGLVRRRLLLPRRAVPVRAARSCAQPEARAPPGSRRRAPPPRRAADADDPSHRRASSGGPHDRGPGDGQDGRRDVARAAHVGAAHRPPLRRAADPRRRRRARAAPGAAATRRLSRARRQGRRRRCGAASRRRSGARRRER